MFNKRQVKGHRCEPLNAELYYHTVLLNADVTCVQWYMYLIACDVVYHPIK